MAKKATKKKAKKKAKRARQYEVWVKVRRDGVIRVKAKTPAEATKLAEEQIEESWSLDEAADWFEGDPQSDVEICVVQPARSRR